MKREWQVIGPWEKLRFLTQTCTDAISIESHIDLESISLFETLAGGIEWQAKYEQ